MTSLPEGYSVEGVVEWRPDHPCQHEAGQELGKALDGTGFALVYLEPADKYVLLSEVTEI